MALNATPAPLMIGLGYAMGIAMAIIVCSPTSGGHFNPAITITMTVFKGFPPTKALRSVLVPDNTVYG